MQTMTSANQSAIEKYLQLYRREPGSKVFAPLAEAYRKNGQIEHALDIALKGVKIHPDFASGRVTLGRIYMAQKLWEKGLQELKQAADLNPEILLAHKLIGECHLEMHEPQKALEAFKMTLYLDPLDEKAQLMVKKLESLSASDYTEQNILSTPKKSTSAPFQSKSYEVDRYTSLVDAFIARQDFGRALESLDEAIKTIGSEPEFLRRKKYVEKRFHNNAQDFVNPKDDPLIAKKIAKLRLLQTRIEARQLFPN